MVIRNIKIVTPNKVIDNGYISFVDGFITDIGEGPINEGINGQGNILMPGFIDLHIHGSHGIDFMDTSPIDYKLISNDLYSEGVTTFLATTLTSDKESLLKVARNVKEAKKDNPSLLGIHLEGPYINEKYKGAQNAAFIRNADISELKELIKESNNNIRYITLAPEKEGAFDFIKEAKKLGVTVSVGHSDATCKQVNESVTYGLTNVTHTHNAMSGHHHRNPGVVTAAFMNDNLFTECICDRIHICDDTLKAFYKIVGPNRFMVITDALSAKHSDTKTFKMFGLDAYEKDGAAYLTSGPLAGSLLSFNIGVKNIKELTNASLIDLSKISSYNQAKSLGLHDRGSLEVGKLADFVLLDDDFNVISTYKNGIKVY